MEMLSASERRWKVVILWKKWKGKWMKNGTLTNWIESRSESRSQRLEISVLPLHHRQFPLPSAVSPTVLDSDHFDRFSGRPTVTMLGASQRKPRLEKSIIFSPLLGYVVSSCSCCQGLHLCLRGLCAQNSKEVQSKLKEICIKDYEKRYPISRYTERYTELLLMLVLRQ